MSKHLFGMILTHQGTFANNRGESEGNTTTLQKILRDGDLYSTVSSEAIRYALRETWQATGLAHMLNRVTPDHRIVTIQHPEFKEWHQYLDDDVLGFMHAKKETVSRRGLLEISRAISTTPWRGETMHNFASAGSNPAVDGTDPIPYAVEVHDTRYQYGFAFTPEFLGRGRDDKGKTTDPLTPAQKSQRLASILHGLINIRRVGGNHARYLADYSPEAIVLRWTDDPAPRFLYCFEQDDAGRISLKKLSDRISGGDIAAAEIIIGGSLPSARVGDALEVVRKAETSSPGGDGEKPVCFPGIKKSVEVMLSRIREDLGWPEAQPSADK